MNKKIIIILVAVSMIFVTGSVMAIKGGGNPHDIPGGVYVTSQGLYYKTFVTASYLPYTGHNGDSFQKLEGGTTEFGPGDPGYRGGRWWIDDGDGIMEENGVDTYLLCPLIGPGYED